MLDNYKNGVRKHICDTLKHKHFFIQSCVKMVDYLCECDRYDDALELARRCSLHDHSKLEDDEVECFTMLLSEEDGNKIPNGVLSDKQRQLIELHWARNRHHPEFFSDPINMSEIDLLEMVCDWAARSAEYNNSLIEFAERVQKDRFHFNNEMFGKIMEYCRVLDQNKI